MAIFIVLALIVGLFVLIVLWVKNHIVIKDIIWNFKHCNVIVYGKKGTGKDIIFDWITKKRKEHYYANVPYTNTNYDLITAKDVSVYPNTYESFINDKITKIAPRFNENEDIYISDAGVYLPSYMDSTLYKHFPSMPIYYALSRHLFNSNVHVNVQNLDRVWKALREQADYYIKTCRTYKLPFILITKVITYDKYESAKANLLPIKTRLMNKYAKSNVDLYNAQNGSIKTGYLFRLKKSIKYDTRYFKSVILDN